MKTTYGLIVAASLLAVSCSTPMTKPAETSNQNAWGKTPEGETVDLYRLSNRSGMEARISTYGGVVVSLRFPDNKGQTADLVHGFDNFEGYLTPPPYFGALIGRYGNRIAHGKFTLNGKEYTLAKNNGDNALHGGVKGFDKRIWKARPIDGSTIELTYTSKDGEEGYPGNLTATVTYKVTDNNELSISYAATTDQPTVVNLTNHTYFNLAGNAEGDILGHEVTIEADRFTPVDKGLIPTGELRSVEGTPFDFRKPHTIGERIGSSDQQIVYGGGYDHNFVLNSGGKSLAHAATVKEPKSGRVMEVMTTEPGLQFYTGNFLDGTIKGKGGKAYAHRSAFCMETQHFPDSPNHPSFPTTTLKPGEKYASQTTYRFSIVN